MTANGKRREYSALFWISAKKSSFAPSTDLKLYLKFGTRASRELYFRFQKWIAVSSFAAAPFFIALRVPRRFCLDTFSPERKKGN